MRKFFVFFSFSFFLMIDVYAQNDDLRNRYESFRNQSIQTFDDFRAKANKQYADYVQLVWKEYYAKTPIKVPKDEDIKPVIYNGIKDNGGDSKSDVDNNSREKIDNERFKIPVRHDNKKKVIIVDDKGDGGNQQIDIDQIIDPPTPETHPQPISPIKERNDNGCTSAFSFYDVICTIRVGGINEFKLNDVTPESLADGWKELVALNLDNTLYDCLSYREKLNLCDWGYLQLLDSLACNCCGKGTNSSSLLLSFLYCQSGYKMRLATTSNKLYVLYASKHNIYNKPYFQVDGDVYYSLSENGSASLNICGASFPNEKPLSLLVDKEQKLGLKMSKGRLLQSEKYAEVKINISENEDLMPFYSSYPTSRLGDNDLSRWAMYANTPICEKTKNELYPILNGFLEGKTAVQKVSILLNWVQTAFKYEYDDKIWGGDRAFFPDETLYYPFCDCEDRSILLSRLVRDLIGLRVALLYYPGHLSTAIQFPSDVPGDYITIDGARFTVADPTYIGAPIGMTMPSLKGSMVKTIVL